MAARPGSRCSSYADRRMIEKRAPLHAAPSRNLALMKKHEDAMKEKLRTGLRQMARRVAAQISGHSISGASREPAILAPQESHTKAAQQQDHDLPQFN